MLNKFLILEFIVFNIEIKKNSKQILYPHSISKSSSNFPIFPRETPFIRRLNESWSKGCYFTISVFVLTEKLPNVIRIVRSVSESPCLSTPLYIFVWHMRPWSNVRFCSIEQPPSFFTRTSREQLLCADSEPFPSSSLPYSIQVLSMYCCLHVRYFQLIWIRVYLVWT